MTFVVGISFSHISWISNHIAGLVDNDKWVLKYRTSTENAVYDNDGDFSIRKMSGNNGAHVLYRVQKLLCDLIDEGHVDNTGEHPSIALRDVVINKRVQNRLLTFLNTDSVKSFVCGKGQLREPRVLRIAIGIKDLVKLDTVIGVQGDVDIITGIINRSRAYLKCIVIESSSLLMNRPVRLGAFSDALGTVDVLGVFTFKSVSMEHEDLQIFAQRLVRLKHLEELYLSEINCVACSYEQCTCRIELPFNERLRKLEISQIDGHILLGSHPSLKSINLENVKIMNLDLSHYKQLQDLVFSNISCGTCKSGECHCTVDLRYNEQLEMLNLSGVNGHILLGSHPSLQSITLVNVKIMKVGLSHYKQLQVLILQDVACTTCTQGECCCTVDLRCNEQLKRLYLQGLKGQIMLDPLHRAECVTLKCIKELADVLHQLKNSCLRHLLLLGENLHVRDGYQQVELKGVITEVLPTLHSLQTLELDGIDLDDDDLVNPRKMKHLEVRLGMRMGVTMTLQCVKRFVDSIIQVQHAIIVDMRRVYIRPAQDTQEAEQYIRDNCYVIDGGIQGFNDGHDEDDEYDMMNMYIDLKFVTPALKIDLRNIYLKFKERFG